MTALPFGIFSRTEQRVLHVIFKAIADGEGCCVASLASLANASNTSRGTARNAIARAIGIGMLKETEHGLAIAGQRVAASDKSLAWISKSPAQSITT